MMKTLLPLTILFTAFSILSCTDTAPPTAEIPSELEDQKVTDSAPNDAVFIGLSVEDAQKLAEKRKLRHRVMKIDGEPQMGTKDYRLDRVNFSIEQGIVTSVKRG